MIVLLWKHIHEQYKLLLSRYWC